MGGNPSKFHLGDIFRDVHDFSLHLLRVGIVGSVTGEFTTSGLSQTIKVTTLDVGDTESALPATALAERNSMLILNTSTTDTLYIGPTGVTADSVVGTTSGHEIAPENSFAIDITDGITLFGIAETGKTIRVKVTELA